VPISPIHHDGPPGCDQFSFDIIVYGNRAPGCDDIAGNRGIDGDRATDSDQTVDRCIDVDRPPGSKDIVMDRLVNGYLTPVVGHER